MTKERRDKLIEWGKEGILEAPEQRRLAKELEAYVAMALRLEQSLHEIIKEVDAKVEAFK